MKKIALLAMGFGDSTLPLAKALCSKGYNVDCFFISTNKKRCKIQSGYDQHGKMYPGIHLLTPNNTDGIDFVTDFPNMNIYSVQILPLGSRYSGILSSLLFFIPRQICKAFFIYLRLKKYDFIDCICQEDFYSFLKEYVHTPFVVSTHEVLCNHQNSKSSVVPVISHIKKENGFLRVFSNKSYADVINTISFSKENLFCVPFGLFNTYPSFKEIPIPELGAQDNYILFIGFLAEYKGLANLYKAILPLIRDVKLVIAGSGYDKSIELFHNLDNTIVINRWISNSEFVNLVRKCRFIVCPYISASQSALPQTAFVFGKPVIASKVGSFPDVIVDNSTGFLYEPNNIEALSKYIEHLWFNDKKYDEMVNHIKKNSHLKPELNWSSISEQYIQMVNKIIERYNEVG